MSKMSSKEYQKRIAFLHPCYICGNTLGKAKSAINHIQGSHGYALNSRAVGRKRPMQPGVMYVNTPQSVKEFDEYHYSCPSCWFSCPGDKKGLAKLSDHIKTHKPKNVDPMKNNNGKIKGAQVAEITRFTFLQDEEISEDTKQTIVEDDEDVPKDSKQDDNEDVDMIKTAKPKSKTSQVEMDDIYQKLAELTNMFKALFSNPPSRDEEAK